MGLTTSDSAGQNATSIAGLAFGNVFPGVPKVVSKYTAVAAAEFLITGTAGDEVSIDFTLPTYMNMNGFNMQLVFQDMDCAMYSSASPDQSNPGYDDLDPWDVITYRLGSSGLAVWLGGMLVPKIGQPPGDYSSVIVLTVAYTGS